MKPTIETLFDHLRKEVRTEYKYTKDPNGYVIPALPQAQCIVIPVLREAIAPILVRNNDSDTITDVVANKKLRVRMIASKTKGVERRRGSQILRTLGVGGNVATNKGYIDEKKGIFPSHVFDLNSFVFGDAVTKEEVRAIHAGVLYSDALTIQAKERLTDTVFRQGGISEEFTNWNAEKKESSSNIFNTRAVRANAMFVQSLVMTGHRMTRAAFNHLLLALGSVGSYGGSTATTGTNLRTHLIGVYWGRFEQGLNAPQEMLKVLSQANLDSDGAEEDPREVTLAIDPLKTCLADAFAKAYTHHLPEEVLNRYIQEELVTAFEASDDRFEKLKNSYLEASMEMGKMFDDWFLKEPKGKGKGKDKKSA